MTIYTVDYGSKLLKFSKSVVSTQGESKFPIPEYVDTTLNSSIRYVKIVLNHVVEM